MSKSKYYYYVQVTEIWKGEDGILYNRKRYVTRINNQNKTAFWSAGEKPLAMPKSLAESLAEGLTMNMFSVQVVKAFWELDENQNL